MNTFCYQGMTRYGEAVSGEIKGFGEGDVSEKLKRQGISPTQLVMKTVKTPFFSREVSNPFKKGPNLDDLAHFNWELHYLLKSGIPLLAALQGLENNYHDHPFGPVIRQLIATLYAGHKLSTALAEHPKFFDKLMISMIRIGEITNKLDEMFLLHHQYLNKSKMFKRQLTDILKQPILGLVGITGTLFVINVSVVPSLVRIFKTFNAELPFLTRLMIAMSEFTVNFWPHMLASLILSLLGFRLYISTQSGRYKWHKAIFRLPMIGQLLYRFTVVRLISSLSVAIHAGIPPSHALALVLGTCENAYARDRINKILEKVERGASFSDSVAAVKFFDPMIQQMIDVGEKTSNFPEMIREVAEFTNRELEHQIRATTSSMQPIFTLIMAIMVGFVAVSLFLPMWDIIYAV
jgi:MSHA biogenesis protein MshG